MAVSLDTPQSLNRYAYVSNMPLGYFDPLGLGCVSALNPTWFDAIRWHWNGEVWSSSPTAIFGYSVSTSCSPDRLGSGDRGGGGGSGQQTSTNGARQTPPSISPEAQACVDQANRQIQDELRTFSGYAGSKLIGRAALGAFSGALASFGRFSKTGNPWVVATGAVVGAASGAVTTMYSDYRTIQKIGNSFMDKLISCMQKVSIPRPPE